MESFVAFFDEVDLEDVRQVGGKGSNLGHLTRAGFRVPPGFVVKADSFDRFLSENGLDRSVADALDSLDFGDLRDVDLRLEELRGLMESCPVPGDIRDDIRKAYARLASGGGGLVAVRSSVGTRDLSASSFPGQMDTYHNVVGEESVVRLVRRCWASVFSYRATVSRHARGVDHLSVFIAPLVQLMVPSECAGVVFTANPLNNRTDQMVINACLGLGEGVVSGEVNADHYVIDKHDGSLLTCEVGEKRVKYVLDEGAGCGTIKMEVDESEAAGECLDSSQLAELASMATDVEALYGVPQDIEWAYSGDSLFVLQSRKITTLDPGYEEGGQDEEEWVSEFDTRVDPDYPCYTLSNISEVLPGVLTPLTISGIDALDYGFVKTNTNFALMRGIEPDSEHTFLGIFYNRAHLNLSVVKSITSRLPGASAQEFERMLPQEDPDLGSGGFRYAPAALLGLLKPLALVAYRLIRTPFDVVRMRRRLDRRIAGAREMGVECWPYPRYLLWMAESRKYRFDVIAFHITASQFAVVFYDFLRKLTERWLDDRQGLVASRLVTGLQNIESAAPSIGIWDLSRMVLGSPRLLEIFERCEPEEIEEALDPQSSAQDADFLEQLDSFLGRFGYRSVFEAELMLPNWEDDPSYVFSMIKNYLGTGPDFSPREIARKQEAERQKTYRDVMKRLKGPRRWIFSFLLSQAHRYIAMREYTKATLIMGIAQIKREYHELSRRFAADGLIPEPTDMFFLTMDEVKSLASGDTDGIPVEDLVRRRRREYERNKTVTLPEYSRGRPRPLETQDVEEGGTVRVLSGIAVSPGRVTGRARVITDPRNNAHIEPREILVAPVTDAAWTPLFVTAGAIVVDVGGPLSHGSIVAREFGIPGVLNVGVATRLIRTGQKLTVDGDRGTVYIHPEEGEKE